MKKIIIHLTAIVMSAVCLFSLSGCFGIKFESGLFICNKPYKSGHVEVIDLSELGHKQEYIVMPETIDGLPYRFSDSTSYGTAYSRFSKNSTLKKIYFEFYDYKSYRWSHGTGGEYYCDSAFELFDALKKVIVNNESAFLTKTVYYNANEWIFSYASSSDSKLFTNYAYIPVYIDENDIEYKCLIKYEKEQSIYLANVAFFFNYDDSPNNGYYWIDDIDDGEKIEIIPPDPEREGYAFCGWYREKECVNEFDFDTIVYKKELNYLTDYKITKDDKVVYENQVFTYPEDYVLNIYAKWTEN